jgi:hypothetical protein
LVLELVHTLVDRLAYGIEYQLSASIPINPQHFCIPYVAPLGAGFFLPPLLTRTR